MPIFPGPLFRTIKGHFGKWKISRTSHGVYKVSPRRVGAGPPGATAIWLYNQASWNLLDVEWRKLTKPQTDEWAKCVQRRWRHSRSNLNEYRSINLNRMMLGMPALTSPPDKFKSSKHYFTADDGYPGMPPGKTVPVWTNGTSKDDTDFDEDTGPIPPPPDPPWGPPVAGDCDADGTSCQDKYVECDQEGICDGMVECVGCDECCSDIEGLYCCEQWGFDPILYHGFGYMCEHSWGWMDCRLFFVFHHDIPHHAYIQDILGGTYYGSNYTLIDHGCKEPIDCNDQLCGQFDLLGGIGQCCDCRGATFHWTPLASSPHKSKRVRVPRPAWVTEKLRLMHLNRLTHPPHLRYAHYGL